MQSKAPDVGTYIEEAAPERQAALRKLRVLCREMLTGYEECMEYGLPCYAIAGKPEVSFASQKQYIALYVLKEDVVNEHREALSGLSVGKGCIRFKRPDRMDFDVIRSLLGGVMKSRSAAC